jgi:Domain of unknown function (DUF4893)
MKLHAILFSLFLFATPVSADGVLNSLLRPEDKSVLASFAAKKSSAVAAAKAAGDAKDVAVLNAALAGKPLSMSGSFDFAGNWSCRTIKLGGLTTLVVYPKFRCSVLDDGSGWYLKKLTGSQRTEGRFYTNSDSELTYLGAAFVAGETASKYGSTNKDSHVAIVERLAENRVVLQFPAPVYESDFDLLVMER